MAYIISKREWFGDKREAVAIALNEDDLRSFVAMHIQVDKTSGALSFDGNYFVKEVAVASTKKTEQNDRVSDPFESITVPSETTPGVFYGVAINDKGYIYACTCKAFEHHPDKACKHMNHVYWNAPFNKSYRVSTEKAPVV